MFVIPAEEDNKLKDKQYYDVDEISEYRDEHDQDEAKYSPEEKSIVDKSEVDRTSTPSEESEDDEGNIIQIYPIIKLCKSWEKNHSGYHAQKP